MVEAISVCLQKQVYIEVIRRPSVGQIADGAAVRNNSNCSNESLRYTAWGKMYSPKFVILWG